jgi:hypothetical protein
MADVYRQKVRALVEGLSDAERAPEVTEALRALVDRIVLTPELRPGRKRATLTVDLEGALAGILHLAAGEKGAAVAAAIQQRLKASERLDVARAHNAEEPPILADGGSPQSMSKLVAGAGFEPAAVTQIAERTAHRSRIRTAKRRYVSTTSRRPTAQRGRHRTPIRVSPSVARLSQHEFPARGRLLSRYESCRPLRLLS